MGFLRAANARKTPAFQCSLASDPEKDTGYTPRLSYTCQPFLYGLISMIVVSFAFS
jgi:hypothetical protein